MDGSVTVPDELVPPARLLDRLRHIAGYSWDENKAIFHSSDDNWHVFGTRFVPAYSSSHNRSPSLGHNHSHSVSHGHHHINNHNHSPAPAHSTSPATPPSPYHSSSQSPLAKFTPSRSASIETNSSGLQTIQSDGSSEVSATSPLVLSHTATTDSPVIEEPVVARVSFHVLREERAFHLAKTLIATNPSYGDHLVEPLDIIRLTPQPGDRGTIIVAIYQNPGKNDLFRLMDLGPAWYWAQKVGDSYEACKSGECQHLDPPISLEHFLEFAIGASECLEILHHGQGIVHGEIRGDAFNFNMEANKVKLVSFGSGLRSFEHGLTSTGWSALSKELGAKNKLLFISPEQTGRMPAEPDTRTDIYSLGVLFWTLLTQRPVFEGETPLDVVQGVLNRRIPNVSAIRIDVPDVLGRVIQKCTSKNVGERYHSASGLRYDLTMVQKFLKEGDSLALRDWHIASKDVTSFFMLPTMMIGRATEKEQLTKVIDRVAKSHAIGQQGSLNTNRYSDGSNLWNDVADTVEGSSDGASSVDGTTRRSGSITQTIGSDSKSRSSFHPSVQSVDGNTISAETVSSGQSPLSSIRTHPRTWERHHSVSFETRSLVDTVASGDRELSRQSMAHDSSSSLSRQLGAAKFRRRGHCEVVAIEGAGGLGKSCLVQSVLAENRRRGYSATAKFDTAQRVAFGPLLKLLSSLFRQVWGERNTETPFHQSLKQSVRPVWPMLHKTLGLPEFLLGPVEAATAAPATGTVTRSISNAQASSLSYSRSMRISGGGGSNGSNSGCLRRQGSSPGSPRSSGFQRSSVHSNRSSVQSSQEFLWAGSSTKSIRLMNTFLDVLRMFTQHKFICFCLEDLHFADDESLDLITQIIATRLKMVLILTYRPDELNMEKVRGIIQPPESEEFPRLGIPTVTRISLSPLSEEDIVQYVSTTLYRPKEDVYPLALVIQSKTAGNPFYMREMLNACHRKKCIWYDYRDCQWHYDLDRLFEQFKGEQNYDVLDTDFITRRLDELPPASRAILSWASLIGAIFSFDLICHLLSGEFYDSICDQWESGQKPTVYSQEEAVAGLQAAIQAYIVVPSDQDDRFRFAHDRYIQAAAKTSQCDARKMHFIIAQTMLEHYPNEPRYRDSTASHICEALTIIKNRVRRREPYRTHLHLCAASATASGARPTAAKYYSSAVALLQPDPWDDEKEDVSYEETIQLYLGASECYLYMGQLTLASGVLDIIFDSGKSPFDKAPAWVLQSRIHTQSGRPALALACLKECLHQMGVDFPPTTTYQTCDADFEKLCKKIHTMDRKAVLNPHPVMAPNDQSMGSIGAVLAEATSAGWWIDSLSFYQLSILMLEMHLTLGPFPQSGMAFLHVAMIALSRFNWIQMAVELGSYCLELFDAHRDPFSLARGYMIYANFIGHVEYPISLAIAQVESSLEHAASNGDRVSAILGFGLFAQLKFFASENYADLEAACSYSCEEIPHWNLDTRGGVMLVAVRQVCRALQGKTRASQSAVDVMTDEQHNSPVFKGWLDINANNGGRSRMFYQTLELAPLFLYGHYDRAVELGMDCMDNMHLLWSARNTTFAMLFYGLSLAGLVLRRKQDPRTQATVDEAMVKKTVQQLEELNKKFTDWRVVTNVNYLCWSKVLEAQIAELRGNHGLAIRSYEESLDHAAEYGFTFEEALGNYLMAGVYIRLSARRSAWSALRDAVALYRQMGAVGIADHIEEEHSLLLHGPMRNPRMADASVQTDFASDAPSGPYRAVGQDDDPQQTGMAALKGERVGAWRGSMVATEPGAGLPTLDMIDLHAILQSSQIISSYLAVDELLKTMCDVILQTCGGSATLAAIVIEDEGTREWCVAASGDPDKGAEAHNPRIPITGTHLVAENVVLYSTRFREIVFVQDIISDERFSNVSSHWLQRNPLGKSVIAIPICHGDKPLLGVLYLEGENNSFTDRNVTVLQLLVNQIGISYSNALTMKAVEKVSAENVSMVSIQKRALAQAIEAEGKAKTAEAEAKRNVKLAEEAAKAKSIFLANVSHELRTPLNGVIGNSELLRDSNLNKDQLEMADSIRVSADLLLTVINDILDFSKMEADKMKLYIIAFNPEEMVREVVRAVSYSNREKTSKQNVTIVKDVNLTQLLIYGDPIRLHQVLGNLISNSLKFTDNGSITIGARVDSETKDKATLTFWVKDTGIGIPPAQLANLFQPFSQADPSTARKYGGSGLGLSICRSLVETMMKGKIELESQEGVGTTAWFTVTFDKATPEASAGDVQHAHARPGQLAEHPSRPSSSELSERSRHHHYSHHHRELSPAPYIDLTLIPKEKIRICIAEDNIINQNIAIRYVRRLGYSRIDAYENGMKAVEGLRQRAKEGDPYHIILMDVQMPVLDGYEATKLIRKDPIDAVRKVLVIAMTASAIQGDREKCLAAGMNDYLAKPVRSEVLKRKLDAYIGASQPADRADQDHPNSSPNISPTYPAAVPTVSSPPTDPNGVPRNIPVTREIIMEHRTSTETISPPLRQPSRTSSDTRLSDAGSFTSESAAAGSVSASSSKRQPRKLTKNRGGSTEAVQDKPKALLQKKNPYHTENQPFDTGTNSSSGAKQSIASSIGSVSKERLTPDYGPVP